MSNDSQWRGTVLSGTTPARQLRTFADEWRKWMDEASDPEQAAGRALLCLSRLDELQGIFAPVAKQAREVLGEVVAETGAVTTEHGRAVPVAGGERVTWDTARLEQLASHPALGATLAPLRRTTITKPSVRIELGDKRKAKGKE